MPAHEPIIDLIMHRLLADDVPSEVAEAVLGALAGDQELEEALAGRTAALSTEAEAVAETQQHVYLSSVTVAGFRGVGPERRLDLEPRPGLTVVVGRNGSGKSSFAEAAELSLTGTVARWKGQRAVWKEGWRNLHSPHPCAIITELLVSGVGVPARVRRSWDRTAALDDARVEVSTLDGAGDGTDVLGLARPFELYRPFLTATDIGRLQSETGAGLFDAIGTILGVDGLTRADKRLLAAGKPHEQAGKALRDGQARLREELAASDDDRARRSAEILTNRHPDLEQLAGILFERQVTSQDPAVAATQELAALAVHEPTDVMRLAGELADAAGNDRLRQRDHVEAAMRTVQLLRLSVEHHEANGDGACPVCGTGQLDADWRSSTESALAALDTETTAARQAAERLEHLVRRVRTALDPVALPASPTPEVPTDELRQMVDALRAAPGEPAALAEHVTRLYPLVSDEVRQVREAAAEWLRERDTGWQQLAEKVRAWLQDARLQPEHDRLGGLVKQARTWLKNSGDQIRADRLAPFAAESQRVWQALRQQSNIELGTMTLAGTGNQRKVVIPVSVDGQDNAAMGVMSQGEIHALALAVFLPRATAEESPLRFIVIDDPVQSMDPAKVDGLARVLADEAERRQVVVFTHDSRLPDALRRLDLNHRTIEVVRAEQSAVTLRPADDPVERYLDDANALARTPDRDLDPTVRAPVVAELCRSALEAACDDQIWRVRLARGEPHDRIEKAISNASKTTQRVALALFDNADRGGDVLPELNKPRYGHRLADAYQWCRKGVHTGTAVADLATLVGDIRELVRRIR